MMNLRSEKVSVIQRIMLHLYLSIIVSIGFFLFYWALDPKNWKLLDASIFVNVIAFILFGILLSLLFFYTEFKNFSNDHLFFDIDKIIVFDKNKHASKTYEKKFLLGYKVHKSFYSIIGYRRINFLFEPSSGKKLNFEAILVKKDHVEEIISRFKTYTEK